MRRVDNPRIYDPEYEQILRGDCCAYCGAIAKHIDHIVPVTRGGGGEWENLTASCRRCNQSKQGKTLLVFLLHKTASGEPPHPSPRAGVVWRRDLKCWAAYVDCVRRYQLGRFDSAEEAVDAIEEWWQANPDAMAPRRRHKLERAQRVVEMWSAGLTLREMAAELDTTLRAVSSFIDRLRAEGYNLPRRGRGAPGRVRELSVGQRPKAYGRGYRHNPAFKTRPWHVQVQAHGEKLTARFATEAEAQAAVAEFRARHRRA